MEKPLRTLALSMLGLSVMVVVPVLLRVVILWSGWLLLAGLGVIPITFLQALLLTLGVSLVWALSDLLTKHLIVPLGLYIQKAAGLAETPHDAGTTEPV